MGKLILIIVIIVTAIFATISISINNRKVETPELVSTSLSHIKAKNLSNEALHYAIKQINQGRITWNQAGNEGNENEIVQVFSNFNILDGSIDSIKYDMNSTLDTLTVTSYASSIIGGELKQYASSALLLYSAGSSMKTFTCSKNITLNGNAEINGETAENVVIDFQSIFGKTMAEMKSMADHYYYNPGTNVGPVNGITYVEFSKSNKKMQLSNWTGEGILIVDGNIQMSGWAEFTGVLFVNGGYFKTSGHGTINGAVYVNTTGTVQLTGNSVVNENETVVSNLLGSQTSTSSFVEILSWVN